MEKRRGSSSAGIVDNPALSNPIPTRPTNFRIEETEAGTRLKCDRDPAAHMVYDGAKSTTQAVFTFTRSLSYDGPYVDITGNVIQNPTSGDVVFSDVSADQRDYWYQVKKTNIYDNTSLDAGPIHWFDPSEFCIVRFNVWTLLAKVYSSNHIPRVFFDLEDTDQIEDYDENKYLTSGLEQGTIAELLTGYGEETVVKSENISDLKYQIKIVVGDDNWIATGVTLTGSPVTNNGLTYYQVFLNDIEDIEFILQQ